MPPVKKLALVTCTSNYERHGNMIRGLRQRLMETEGYALYVLTNYGIYNDGMDYNRGEAAVYSLLDKMELDGCILDSNLGSNELAEKIAGRMVARGVPVLTINLQVSGVPYLHLETRTSGTELLNHLIVTHGCRRINLVLNKGSTVVSRGILETYRRVLEEHRIPFEESRVVNIPVGTKTGRGVYDTFDQRGVMRDCNAVLCVHDVCALGLIMEMESRGFRVPEDLRVCSMNCSANSIAFRPRITGIDSMDQKAAELGFDLMDRMVRGEEIPRENTYSSIVRYFSSCGCETPRDFFRDQHPVFQRIILNKIEAGNQIGRMMQYNSALENVESLSRLADNIYSMMEGVDCHSWFCCINESDPEWIESNRPDPRPKDAPPYDERMRVLMGCSERTGLIRDQVMELSRVVPTDPRSGDLFLILPFHHGGRAYGYTVFLNELLPVDVYNYRICQDSIGNSLESLHQQMVLRRSIEELDQLHMQDQMTGLYNRFALRRYAENFVSDPAGYSVAMLDMDGLKDINDTFGHLAGNNAISIVASAIRRAAGEEDLTIRYGGDEFLILSRRSTAEAWERCREDIHLKLAEVGNRQQLSYPLGVSMGYAISSPRGALSLEKCIESADRAMYEDKKAHKAKWQ